MSLLHIEGLTAGYKHTFFFRRYVSSSCCVLAANLCSKFAGVSGAVEDLLQRLPVGIILLRLPVAAGECHMLPCGVGC